MVVSAPHYDGLAGDFNSTPSGITYNALTQRPIRYTPSQQEEMMESVTFDFREVQDEEEEILEDTLTGGLTHNGTEGLDFERSRKGMTIRETKELSQQRLLDIEDQPLNITSATLEHNDLVLAHHEANPALTSLYARGLKLCQPDNATNAFGEPPFTNWAHKYKETLDYIFVIGDSINRVKLTGLLKMPRIEEMGVSEPQEGRFPSDHVCEMVEVELSSVGH